MCIWHLCALLCSITASLLPSKNTGSIFFFLVWQPGMSAAYVLLNESTCHKNLYQTLIYLSQNTILSWSVLDAPGSLGTYVKPFCKVGLQLVLGEIKCEGACSSAGLTVQWTGRGMHGRPAFCRVYWWHAIASSFFHSSVLRADAGLKKAVLLV